jgi:hypothetical protein
MSTLHHPMPDFADALERHLRRAAAAQAAAGLPVPTPDGLPLGRPEPAVVRPRPAREPLGLPRLARRPFAAAGSVALVALVVALVLVWGGSGSNTPRAVALVLRAPLVALPEAALPGMTAERFLGPGAAGITRGHEVPTAAGPAYFYDTAQGACLTAPDPATDDPALERGVMCASRATFERFGVSLTLAGADRGTYYAAIPQGVRNPTVRTADGAVRELRPTDFGVVTVTGGVGTIVTLYDRDGDRREDQVVPGPITGAPTPRTAPAP